MSSSSVMVIRLGTYEMSEFQYSLGTKLKNMYFMVDPSPDVIEK